MIYIEWELFETNPNKDTIVDEIHYFWLTISDLRCNSWTFKLEPFVEHDIARSILVTNAWNERSGKLVSRWDSYEVQYNLYLGSIPGLEIDRTFFHERFCHFKKSELIQ